jgi:hypothetical protein
MQIPIFLKTPNRRPVLCSSNEVYAVSQDMCVSCGSIGIDEEGQLISCSQCGQSYHPYCVGFTKMVCFIFQRKSSNLSFFLLAFKSSY